MAYTIAHCSLLSVTCYLLFVICIIIPVAKPDRKQTMPVITAFFVPAFFACVTAIAFISACVRHFSASCNAAASRSMTDNTADFAASPAACSIASNAASEISSISVFTSKSL
jgi:hypothetical protein